MDNSIFLFTLYGLSGIKVFLAEKRLTQTKENKIITSNPKTARILHIVNRNHIHAYCSDIETVDELCFAFV